MKTTVGLSKELTHTALKTHLNTLHRKRNKESNMLIAEILDTEINQYQTAMNTLVEGK